MEQSSVNSTALKTYFDTHTPNATPVVTIDGRNTSQYGMFTLNGLTCPEFSLNGGADLKLGTYIVRETATNSMYQLNSTPLFGTVVSQATNGYEAQNYVELRQHYFYNGGLGRALYLRAYPAQADDLSSVLKAKLRSLFHGKPLMALSVNQSSRVTAIINYI